jgi:hypothetical protein
MGEKPKGWARKRKEYFILVKFSKRQGFCHNPYHRKSFFFFYYFKKWQLKASNYLIVMHVSLHRTSQFQMLSLQIQLTNITTGYL